MNKLIEIRTEGVPLKDITEFKELQGNLKIMDKNRLDRLMQNIISNGFIAPVFIWQGQIVDGHQRLKALNELFKQGYILTYKGKSVGNKVPFVTINAKDKTEAGKFILTYNSQYGEIVGLDEFLNNFNLNWEDIDSQLMLDKVYDNKFGKGNDKLKEDWVMPPFSVLDTRQQYWHERKDEWYKIMGNTTFTRENVLGTDLISTINSGTSLFDPVLAECIIRWFVPKNGTILNLFAGGVEPNIVAAYKGHKVTGIELRQEQIDHTIRVAKSLQLSPLLNLHCDDIVNMNSILPKNETYDAIFSCPPYYDLEVYDKNDKRDLANKPETEFDTILEKTILESSKKLKANRFAVFVVSEVRNSTTGGYRGLVPKVISWFQKAGLTYYNEIILINSIGTLPFRINNSWQYRKVGRMHQNVLVFYKGAMQEIDKTFDKVRQIGSVHQKILVFYKGEINAIKTEYPSQAQSMDS